eukprot:CAMPEP_0202728738 /NCGR_PEP_ID=MMETSP1385-20130828/185774_1 /ASSEMBLY_ACC=CAM_ASM_000861 /TAXON_ID=933848 /ORGANISM="Elphidium margaritaceum" /LENGTH=746 /DNA_ID=CAMNT_0049394989 /DNA_START=177 /DNA_END=2418 /DNA_ORIENTATION=+
MSLKDWLRKNDVFDQELLRLFGEYGINEPSDLKNPTKLNSLKWNDIKQRRLKEIVPDKKRLEAKLSKIEKLWKAMRQTGRSKKRKHTTTISVSSLPQSASPLSEEQKVPDPSSTTTKSSSADNSGYTIQPKPKSKSKVTAAPPTIQTATSASSTNAFSITPKTPKTPTKLQLSSVGHGEEEYEVLRKTNKQLQQEVQTVRNEYDTFKQTQNQKFEQFKEKSDSTCAEWQQKYTQKEHELYELQKSLNDTNDQRASQVQQQIDGLSTENERLKHTMSTSVAETEQLRTRLREIELQKSLNDTNDQRASQAQQQIDELSTENERLKHTMSTSVAETEQLRTRLRAIEQAEKQANTQYTALQVQYKMLCDEKQTFEAKQTQIREDMEHVKEYNQLLKQNLADAEARSKQSEELLEAEKQRYEQMRMEQNSGDVDRLQQQQEQEDRARELQTQVNMLKESVSELQCSNEEAEQSYKKQIEALKTQLKQEQDERESEQQTRADLQRQINQLEREKKTALKSSKSSKSVTAAADECEKLRQKLANMAQSETELTEVIKKKNARIKKLEAQMSLQQKTPPPLQQAKIPKMNEQVSRSELEALRKENKELKEQVREKKKAKAINDILAKITNEDSNSDDAQSEKEKQRGRERTRSKSQKHKKENVVQNEQKNPKNKFKELKRKSVIIASKENHKKKRKDKNRRVSVQQFSHHSPRMSATAAAAAVQPVLRPRQSISYKDFSAFDYDTSQDYEDF